MKHPSQAMPDQRGSALVITLAFLTIITILIVGFVVSMRTERMAAGSMAENIEAKQVAQSALVHAVSLLRDNIPDPGDPTQPTPQNGGKNWISNPGRLTIMEAGSSSPRFIPLHTGEAASANPVTAVNLNAASPSTGKYPITGGNDPMWVSWVNMVQDPSAEPSATNKLVARYAFWIDDEATKVNVNVARGKPATMETDLKLPANWGSTSSKDLLPYIGKSFDVTTDLPTTVTFPLTHPAAVNLSAVGLGSQVGAIEKDVTIKGFFKNPEEIKAYFVSDADYEAEKFNLTVFGRSPEFNVFGKSRIFLTRWASNTESGPGYQLSYHPEQPMTFYAATMGLTTAEANNQFIPARDVQKPVIRALAKYLSRDDWPGLDGKKFRWQTTSGDEADQIAININSLVTTALRGSPGGQGSGATGSNVCDDLDRKMGTAGDFPGYTGAQGNFFKGPNSGKGMIGMHPFPQLSEMGIRLAPVAVTSSESSNYANLFKLNVNVVQEVYLPPGYFRDTGTGTGQWTAPSATSGYQTRSYAPYVKAVVTGPGVNITNIAKDGSTITFAGQTLKTVGPSLDGYTVMALGRTVKKTSGEFTTSSGSPQLFSRANTYTVTVQMRSGIGDNSQGLLASQMAPFPIPSAQAAATLPPGLTTGNDSDGYLEFTLTISGADVQDILDGITPQPTLTCELNDPRTYYNKSAWQTMTAPATNTLGFANQHLTADASKLSKFAMWNLYGSGTGGALGMIAFAPTGMQRGVAWDTLQLHSYSAGSNEVPDWVVLDLLAPYYAPRNYPDSAPVPVALRGTPNLNAVISLRNSTAGKINLNSRIYPSSSPVFTPPARVKPLQALLANMPNGSSAAAALANWQTDSQYFDYVGRICDVPGVADGAQGPTDFEKEVILRNLAGMMATQSNVFGIWGAAQTVKKRAGSTNFGEFESGDLVTGEKRFYAVVERYVWTGRDGVGGNGAVDGTGNYSALAKGAATARYPFLPPTSGYNGFDIFSGKVKTSDPSYVWPPVDGPQAPQLDSTVHGTVAFTSSTLEAANNPLAAPIKYRIIYFTYLD